MSAETCELCARPIAGDHTDPDDVHCFRRFDPNGKDGSHFEVECLRLAVARLRGEPSYVRQLRDRLFERFLDKELRNAHAVLPIGFSVRQANESIEALGYPAVAP